MKKVVTRYPFSIITIDYHKKSFNRFYTKWNSFIPLIGSGRFAPTELSLKKNVNLELL